MTYRLVNRALFVAGLVVITIIALVHCFGTGVCMLRLLEGRECMLCGCTRDFFKMIHGDCNFINPVSPFIFALLIFEAVYRGILSFVLVGRKIARADAIFHALLLVTLVFFNFLIIFNGK